MRPQLIKVPTDETYSFRITNEMVQYFYNPLHFHPELELTYVLKSKGIRFIGDSVESFYQGDLVLVGPNLPHCWKNDPEYFEGNSTLKTQAIVVQFTEDFAGTGLFNLPELLSIKKLIQDSKNGIIIFGQTKQKIKKRLTELIKIKGVGRIRSLLEILEIIALSKERNNLSEYDSGRMVPPEQLRRLNSIYQYTLDNFKETINLNEIAQVANLTPNAFCRFFKFHNRKTYFQFINEIRISHSCKLLRDSSYSIAQVAYDSGFNNLAHFNRTFKRKRIITPFAYRKQKAEIPVETSV